MELFNKSYLDAVNALYIVQLIWLKRGREEEGEKGAKGKRERVSLFFFSIPSPSPFPLPFGCLPRRLLIDVELTSLITRAVTKMKH